MRSTRRSKRIAALAVGLSFVAAACGDDDDDGCERDTATDEAPTDHRQRTTEATAEETDGPETTEATAAEEPTPRQLRRRPRQPPGTPP